MHRRISPRLVITPVSPPPHDLPLLLLLLPLLSWGAHDYAARLDLPPPASRAEGSRRYTPIAGLQLLLLLFFNLIDSMAFWLSLLENTPCSRLRHRIGLTMVADHFFLLRQGWVALAPHQTPCPRSYAPVVGL